MRRRKGRSRHVLNGGHGGDHLVLWYRTEKIRNRQIARFLSAGMKENDLLAIILPLRELEGLEKSLVTEGFPLNRVLDEGSLLLFASEEFLPCEGGDCRGLANSLSTLRKKARSNGRGLRVAGRIAPVLFESGNLDGALMVEQFAEAGLGDARLLCLYDARALEGLPDGYMQEIDNVHTHVLGETENGGVEERIPGPHGKTSRRKE